MQPFSRDIQRTLLIKLILLFLLWFVCFKDVKKPVLNLQQWMFSAPSAIPNALSHNPTGAP